MEQFVYSFNEGTKDMSSVLGMKGANLAEMTKLGLPVPFGFTIATSVCKRYYEGGKTIPDEIIKTIYDKIEELEQVVGKKFGNKENPLLVSVRSGAEVSMSGTLETILDLGLTDETVEGLAKQSGDSRFAYDCYLRFVQMFGSVVLGIKSKKFSRIIGKKRVYYKQDQYENFTEEQLKELLAEFKDLIHEETGKHFPQDARVQLMMAIEAIFNSWNNSTAVLYRKINSIEDMDGTAVNIQAMVYGNMGNDSASGAAFTRNPINGEREVFGEFLINAQGNEFSTGIRSPHPITNMAEEFPQLYESFMKITQILEKHFKDMQDMEFVIERNKLYVLRTRSGKRTAHAAVKIAVDMESEGLIDKKTALMRLTAGQIDQLLHPTFDEKQVAKATKLVQGLAASPGAACGQIYFSSFDATEALARGERPILVKNEITQEDLPGMVASEGILSVRGGRTSYAAVVARGMGKCYVSGCGNMTIDEEEKKIIVADMEFDEGDYISLNGSDGIVYQGKIGTVIPDLSGDFATLTSWADEIRTLKVRANADSPKEAKLAVEFGAQGIGLCRTEHMLYTQERINLLQKVIKTDSQRERREILGRLMPFLKADFKEIYEIMEERPVTIRLLDPPLHEVGQGEEEKFDSLSDYRGCRLTMAYPEITQMLVEAIISAAIEVRNEKGFDIIPEIMIPFVGNQTEVAFVKSIVNAKAKELMDASGTSFKFLVGTMIETPRAALTSGEIAKEADFFSFGTNDLTKLSLGMLQDNAGKTIREYRSRRLIHDDPFQTLDQTGVGPLIEYGVKRGKEARPNIRLGICGDHGGDPKSIDFFQRVGLGYVSCSPYRVPIARLAAAQAAIRNKR